MMINDFICPHCHSRNCELIDAWIDDAHQHASVVVYCATCGLSFQADYTYDESGQVVHRAFYTYRMPIWRTE